MNKQPRLRAGWSEEQLTQVLESTGAGLNVASSSNVLCEVILARAMFLLIHNGCFKSTELWARAMAWHYE